MARLGETTVYTLPCRCGGASIVTRKRVPRVMWRECQRCRRAKLRVISRQKTLQRSDREVLLHRQRTREQLAATLCAIERQARLSQSSAPLFCDCGRRAIGFFLTRTRQSIPFCRRCRQDATARFAQYAVTGKVRVNAEVPQKEAQG